MLSLQLATASFAPHAPFMPSRSAVRMQAEANSEPPPVLRTLLIRMRYALRTLVVSHVLLPYPLRCSQFNSVTFAKSLPGITGPLGFFDPLGFTEDATEGKIRFYREVELKHGRVAMLAALGFLVAEPFHPLFGGEIDVPSYVAFQETPLQTFWPAVVLVISILEVFSVFTFNSPLGGEPWSIRSDHAAGDVGFDPLGLKPTNPAELAEMQTKEINNGRLAMIGIAGMVVQELVSGDKLF
jgi:hypothetical protein